MLQWLILHHNTATGAAGSNLQTPFSGFKDRQVTQKRGPKKQVGCKIEGKWSQKRKVRGRIPGSIVDPLMEDREQVSIGTGNSQL